MNIFRHEKTNRIIGDDFIHSIFGVEFWETPQGESFSAAGSLTQPTQILSSEGRMAFSGSATFTQLAQILAATAHNLTGTGVLTQPAQTLTGTGNTEHLSAGGLSMGMASMGSNAYETFLASLSGTHPVAVLASDGKQTYIGEITYTHGTPVFTIYAYESHLAGITTEQFLQILSGYGEMGTSQTIEAYGSLTQLTQKILGCARPTIPSMEVITGRKYRVFKNFRYPKKGKPVFAGWSRY
jgi:hypothetical protein